MEALREECFGIKISDTEGYKSDGVDLRDLEVSKKNNNHRDSKD